MRVKSDFLSYRGFEFLDIESYIYSLFEVRLEGALFSLAGGGKADAVLVAS
jgi:hypothetical protein